MSQQQSQAVITLNRAESFSNVLRKYAVSVDGKKVTSIGSGEGKTIQLAPGSHKISIAMDFYKSEPVQLQLKPGDIVPLVCGDFGPASLKETFSTSGLGKMAKSLFNPGQALYIKRSDGQTLTDIPTPAGGPHQAGIAAVNTGASGGGRLFLSYRRSDSQIITGRISDRLFARYGQENVFRDVDSIPLGVDFRSHIRESIKQCQVLLVIIGTDWMEVTNSQGIRRIDNPIDPVRVEIELALENDIPIIPVLVKGANMPSSEALPESIASIAYSNAFVVPEEPYFHLGLDKLISDLDGLDGFQKANNFCMSCGSEVAGGFSFCTNCGSSI